jgi:miniconductance mechanosensitive channel
MLFYLEELLTYFGMHRSISVLIALAATLISILLISWIAHHLTKRYVVKFIYFLISKAGKTWGKEIERCNVFGRVTYLLPVLVFYFASHWLDHPDFPITQRLVDIIQLIISVYYIVVLGLIVSALLNSVEGLYKTLAIAKRRPIKSYIQVAKLILFIITSVLVVSAVLNKSPAVFLTSLGAATAILMLIFRDSILGFVASIQIALYDMVRIGDWIEVPEFGADGDVVDMSLNTVKVQNFDKTIVTIPTYSLLTNGVKNWRGMTEAGGRRIKRSIYIDLHSIKFCDDKFLQRMQKIQCLKQYLQEKNTEISHYNQENHIDKSNLINGRQLTNIGIFRAYIKQYLHDHPKVHNGLTFLIRQLQPSEKGLPLEIYIFTNDVVWTNYEEIQADIFDHILAAVTAFDLRIFQNLSEQNVHVNIPQAPLVSQVA